MRRRYTSVAEGVALHGLGHGIEEQDEDAGGDEGSHDVTEDPDFAGHACSPVSGRRPSPGYRGKLTKEAAGAQRGAGPVEGSWEVKVGRGQRNPLRCPR